MKILGPEKKVRIIEVRLYLLSFERYLCFYKESDDVMGGSTRAAQHSFENNSRNIKAVFFKLGIGDVHHGRNIMTPVVPLP